MLNGTVESVIHGLSWFIHSFAGVMFSQLSNQKFWKLPKLTFAQGAKILSFFSSKSIFNKRSCFFAILPKKSFVKNVHVYTKNPCTVTFFKYKIITKLLIESEFCYVTFVVLQWIKLKSIFSSCFTKETKRAMLINNN